MKKVININFTGRIIPIEETAYDLLKNYTESLRNYFAHEESRDEIINDIESRIGELFDARLKKGATCITDEDVNAIADTLGRPADFAAADEQYAEGVGSSTSKQTQTNYANTHTEADFSGPRRFFRNENDKILGGVASGLANYLHIDPAIVRILFVLTTMVGGLGLLAYIIMWIVAPSKSLMNNVKKRLYRNPDDKVLGGVAGGLASYLDVNVLWPRIVFILPLLLGILAEIFEEISYFSFRSNININIGEGLGGTLFVTYLILWIVLPEAKTASEKLEMKGERVDLNSIRNTVMSDLQGFKSKTQTFASEVSDKAAELGEKAKEATRNFGPEVSYAAKRSSRGLGYILGILFKAFFLMIAGVIVFALIMSLVALLVGGVSLFTVKNYLLAGTWQNLAGWGTLLFFIGVPVFALVTWFIRRMMKLKNHNPYLRTVFLSLFIFGSICAFALASMLGNDLKDEGFVKVENSLAQPNGGKLIVKSDLRKNRMHFKMGMLQFGDMRVAKDSALFDAVGVRIFKSPDSNFHLYQAKFSRGENYEAAEKNAQTINHGYAQIDSVLRIDNYFTIARGAKWRGQEVVAVIEVPVGKKIRIEKSIDRLKWHSFRVNNEYDEEEVFSRWYDNSDWESGVDMVMQANGKLKRVDGEMTEEEKEQKDELKELKRQDQGGDDYRYNQPKDTIRQIKKGDTTLIITNSAKTKQSKPALLPLPAVTLFPFLR